MSQFEIQQNEVQIQFLICKMLDYQSTIPIEQRLQTHSQISNWDNQPFILSARPKMEQLPFLNNLKCARQLLISLKNQKLRKNLYIVPQSIQKPPKQSSDIYRHQKAKLSVMDLISEQGKFQQLSNTIQSNAKKQFISPLMQARQSNQKEKTTFDCQFQQTKQISDKNVQKKKKPSILTKKNKLAGQLNILGHQLEETCIQVEQLQKVFSTLCQFYSENLKAVDRNLKMKEQKQLVKEKIRDFQDKIDKNQKNVKYISERERQFDQWYSKAISGYVKQTINFNQQTDQILSSLSPQRNLPAAALDQNVSSSPSSLSSCQQRTSNKALQINLRFMLLKSELEKIKLDRRNNAVQSKNKDRDRKMNKNDGQINAFSKLYVSEIYTL